MFNLNQLYNLCNEFDLEQFFIENEFAFNEEYYNAVVYPNSFRIILNQKFGEIGGWFVKLASTDPAEWNIIRPFGVPEISLALFNKCLNELPVGEYQIIVPLETVQEIVLSCSGKFMENIIWFSNFNIGNIIIASKNKNDIDLPIIWRRYKIEDPFHADLCGYIGFNGKVVSFVRSTKVTPRTMEVYIETDPQFQNRGFATVLLREAIKEAQKIGRKLIYVVSENNLPSLRVAEKNALVPFQKLARILYRKQ